MSDPSAEWPDPSWHIGQRDHLHAFGVIVAAFNQLEFVLFVLFLRFVKGDPAAIQRIFVILQNHHRLELLENGIEMTVGDPQLKELLLYFAKGYKILNDNRNFLGHSHTILNNPTQDHLTFGKGSKRQPDKWSFAHMKLLDLQKIAEDIYRFWQFGSYLDSYMNAKETAKNVTVFSPFGTEAVREPPLPDKPPEPMNLPSSPHGVLQ